MESVDRCNLILKVVKLLIYLLSALGAHGRSKVERGERKKADFPKEVSWNRFQMDDGDNAKI